MNQGDLHKHLTDAVHRTTEADIQASIRNLLLFGRLDLSEDQVVNLEQPSGGGRIDIEAGRTVIEVKKALPVEGPTDKHLNQLQKYVQQRQDAFAARYVGVLTDGVQWTAWHIPAGHSELELVDTFRLTNNPDSIKGLIVWLDGLMATVQSIPPSPKNVDLRLGATSSATKLDLVSLQRLYEQVETVPDVRLKRQLWQKLLTVASGDAAEDADSTELFLEHTYLVVMAELIGHAVLGFDLSKVTREQANDYLRGKQFADVGVFGVIEQDFFDWVGDTPEGLQWVADLARRISRFEWGDVEHDVLKVLYESVIGSDTRHQLGEYYTPDWLANLVVNDVVDEPKSQRVLDPACGSGTFLFWSLRHVLAAHEEAGMSIREAVKQATSQVFGIDVHPVAVTLARITYLLAIGKHRLAERDPFSVPVYLGDSLQFDTADPDRNTIWAPDGLVVYVAEDDSGRQPTLGGELGHRKLVIPESVIDSVETFDQLIHELTELACDRNPGAARPDVRGLLKRYGVKAEDQETIVETYETLCDLNDDGRNHIWGYYLRNLARPRWLTRPENRVDRIVGNPPWLAYQHMPEQMQEAFKLLAQQRDLWVGGSVATTQDLSALFLVRAVEQYLSDDGRFGMVVPYATLSRQAYEGFRRARWSYRDGQTVYEQGAAFDTPWRFVDIKPDIFPVPSAVVRGKKTQKKSDHTSMPHVALSYTGRAPKQGLETPNLESQEVATIPVPSKDHDWSPYRDRFYQGAQLTPRVLACVREVEASPLGVPSGRLSIESLPSQHKPWNQLETVSGHVEEKFVRPAILSQELMPFFLSEDDRVMSVVPWHNDRLVDFDDPGIHEHPGLAAWLNEVESRWKQHRAKSNKNKTLVEAMNERRKLSHQFKWMDRPRVVYGASGTNLCAAILNDPRAVVEKSLYWCSAASLDEAYYLTAILNSRTINDGVKVWQSVGAFGARHLDLYVWGLPIPHYDRKNELHRRIVELARQAEQEASKAPIEGVKYPDNRGVVRSHISSTLDQIDAAMEELLKREAERQDTEA